MSRKVPAQQKKKKWKVDSLSHLTPWHAHQFSLLLNCPGPLDTNSGLPATPDDVCSNVDKTAVLRNGWYEHDTGHNVCVCDFHDMHVWMHRCVFNGVRSAVQWAARIRRFSSDTGS